METRTCIAETLAGVTPAVLPQSHVEASLTLDFELDEATKRTVLAASHQEPPLRVVRAFPVDDAALVHLHNVSGGLLGGDRLALTVRIGAGARAQITTTGATRVYRPRKEASPTTQLNEISVGEDALLEYVPDPIIPFAGARFSQRTTVQLDRGAGLFWWEVVAPGREARGEIFAYDRLEIRTDLLAIGRPIAAERVRLEPRNQALSSIARLGVYRTWATFYICRAGVESSAWVALEQDLREVAGGLTRPGHTLWGVSALAAHGVVVRCVSLHSRDVLAGLRTLWRAAKLHLYNREAVPPRKVN
jgi:urease accessory protein